MNFTPRPARMLPSPSLASSQKGGKDKVGATTAGFKMGGVRAHISGLHVGSHGGKGTALRTLFLHMDYESNHVRLL